MRFLLKVFLVLIFSFIFYFGSFFIFSSVVKACGETCYGTVDYCYSGENIYKNPTTCASTESCQYGYDTHYCGPGTDYYGETYSYAIGSCEYDPACEAEIPPPEEYECTSGPCCDGYYFRPSTYSCDSWTEYGCPWGASCGSDYGRITYNQYCSGSSSDCDGNITDSDWQVSRYCNSWEICSGSGCACSGSCLNQPTNPSPNNNAEDVKLPITLEWRSVEGASYYRYEINGSSEIVDTPKATFESCELESNTSYNWRVQACCDSSCTNPGPWSNTWNFETSLAPELISPENNSIDISIPITFDWCGVDEAQSYYIRAYMGEEVIELPAEKKDDVLPSEASFGREIFTKNTIYKWEVATCLNENLTQCGVNCDESQEGDECGDYGHKWRFVSGEISLPTPEITSPKSPDGVPVVNFSNYLGWKPIGIYGVSSYRYQIRKGGEIVVNSSVPAEITSVYFESFWEDLDFNETYIGEVKSCWDEEGNNCEEVWSEERSFKTTGNPPTFNEEGSGPVNGATNVLIPTKLNWDTMPGAASYYYEVSNTTGAVKTSEVLVEYPILNQNTLYWWRVKTCADNEGEICGGWSERSFTTFTLSPPINPDPEDNEEFLTSERYLKWEGTAKYYQYKVDYQGTEKIPLTIVYTNSVLLPIEQLELGNYTWWVKACLDENCEESSEFAGPWRFNLVQEECKKSLVPCGKNCDVAETSWNEREPCQFKHIFLLINNVLDFILWRLGLIILVLLTIVTGVIYYFSMGAPQTMVKVKSLLKSAGIGYGIIFLGWLIINWILVILGYQVGVFGKWWQIIF